MGRDVFQLRSRPETFLAEYFVDTGTFACEETKMVAFEGYYRPGPLLVGTEYFFQWAKAAEAGDPRLELAYGYGQLDRFDLSGGTQFFQSRIQLTF